MITCDEGKGIFYTKSFNLGFSPSQILLTYNGIASEESSISFYVSSNDTADLKYFKEVIPDKKLGLLHINPGASGYNGIHKVRTAIRFEIKDKRATNLDVIELGPRSLVD